ncbi:MAG: glycoside hydrolase family 92 protein [Chlorobi bacterium]|nr:glycoside hydrolase family 92 protein [Chlorobiota bacterium]
MIFNSRNILAAFLSLSSFLACAQKNETNLNYVDPSIGGVGVILEPTRPTVHLPNSMVRVFPNRKDQLDDQISNFQLTITSHRLYKVFAFMPVCGIVNSNIWNKRYEYSTEILTPYYYKTAFEDFNNSIEFTPQARSGYFRLSFVDNSPHFIRMGIFNSTGEIKVEGKRIITGIEEFAGMKAFFYAEVNTDISDVKYQNTTDKKKLLIRLGDKPQVVSFRYGISYISIEQAKRNLQNEISEWDFESIKNHAFQVWDKAFSQINVEGGTIAQKRVFYTALYRAYERMVDINEYGKYYSAYDHKIHESNEPFYVDNWIWDTYIALEPLHMILNPDMAEESIRSYIKMYEQSGTMPSFALVFGDWPAMTGNFAASWMTDAWFKGLREFDLEKAYEGLKKNSLEATLLPWRNGPKCELDYFYDENGYYPGLYPGEKETVKEVSMPWERRQSVSVTLDNSYSDWCLAQLASQLNKKEDEKLFLKRSQNYKNVFRVDKGIMWPRDKDGKWIEPYDPRFADRMYFTENNAYTYNWDVKHDLHGLFDLMDESNGAEATLDQLFREDLGTSKWKFWSKQPDASGLVGQFVMGNEPSFHIPYIYNYLGSPWKTQKRIRMLLDAFFTDNLFGIPGDEDGGAMSSFVIFSMMGFFPVTPGIPVYNIGSPVFEKISIDLPNQRTFTVIAENSSKANKYIQKAFLNGKPLNRPWFTHNDIVNGGTLKLIMGSKPNKQWGRNKEDSPPSALNYKN